MYAGTREVQTSGNRITKTQISPIALEPLIPSWLFITMISVCNIFKCASSGVIAAATTRAMSSPRSIAVGDMFRFTVLPSWDVPSVSARVSQLPRSLVFSLLKLVPSVSSPRHKHDLPTRAFSARLHPVRNPEAKARSGRGFSPLLSCSKDGSSRRLFHSHAELPRKMSWPTGPQLAILRVPLCESEAHVEHLYTSSVLQPSDSLLPNPVCLCIVCSDLETICGRSSIIHASLCGAVLWYCTGTSPS